MLLVSWNVNGLKACWEKGLRDFINSADADIICLQETKVQQVFTPLSKIGYYDFWAFAEQRGYSGTVCLCKEKPLDVFYGIENPEFDNEGRVITIEYEDFYLVNCYVPNSKGSLQRYYFRLDWDIAFREYLCKLKLEKPVIVCGDFNVAHTYIDVYPENLSNEENPAGFLEEERDGLEQLFDCGFVDTFRHLYPDKKYCYSWWSNRLYKRCENRGWRIDYFLATNDIIDSIEDAGMYSEVYGSDHCPVFLEVTNG